MDDIIIVGAGIGGLTLGLALHEAGIPCRIFESAAEIKPIGVGINLLPHATRELAALGLEEALARVAIETTDATFFNRFGQLIYQEPLGRAAGYEHPQFSIHRGDLQMVLLDAFRRARRARPAHHQPPLHRCRAGRPASPCFSDGPGGADRSIVRGRAAIACDGINSAIRKQFFPDEGEPRYSGVNMWRGVTRWKPMLSGASMVRAGWLSHGKMVIYPIRAADADGLQLVNWVAEIETPTYRKRDWNRRGLARRLHRRVRRLAFRLARRAGLHPRRRQRAGIPDGRPGSAAALELRPDHAARRRRAPDGAARLQRRRPGDPRCARADAALLRTDDPVAALAAYEKQRLEATTRIVLANRTNPPDAILREVYRRTGDKPFDDIDDVISRDELTALSDGYKRVAGYSKDALRG